MSCQAAIWNRSKYVINWAYYVNNGPICIVQDSKLKKPVLPNLEKRTVQK